MSQLYGHWEMESNATWSPKLFLGMIPRKEVTGVKVWSLDSLFAFLQICRKILVAQRSPFWTLLKPFFQMAFAGCGEESRVAHSCVWRSIQDDGADWDVLRHWWYCMWCIVCGLDFACAKKSHQCSFCPAPEASGWCSNCRRWYR